jgi:arginyl-tRNA synthetase
MKNSSPHLFQHILSHILHHCVPEIAGGAALEAQSLSGITVEFPRDTTHGDVSTNVAMVLTKPLGKSPREIAEALLPHLEKLPHLTAAEVAGAGFINLRFAPAFWQQELVNILNAGTRYGESEIGRGQSVNVEYVSANPTGPMHIGHGRGAVVGDALALLLQKASYAVVKEYYINDAGGQVETLARSAYLRYREAYGEAITIPQGMYPREYLKAVGEGLKQAYGGTLLDASEAVWLPDVKRFAIDAMMAMIREDLAELGITHDVFTSEQALRDAGWLERGIGALEAKGLMYRGTLEPPKGKAPEDFEAAEQTLFRSTDYGDDSDRPVVKSNGDYTYFAGDIGYAAHKIERGFDALVMLLGADHAGYVSRMKALVAALSDKTVEMNVQLCQLVKLMDGGVVVKMSKRSGSFVTVREVTEEVGKDVLRFVMLTRKPEQPLDFDLQKVKEQSRDNPVFYVQYAHARCQSVLRLAHVSMPEAHAASATVTAADVALLMHEAELALIKLLASFPRVVEAAAKAYEPHRIAYFLQEVAAAFHGLWNYGSGETSIRFVVDDNAPLTTARLALARATATVIAAGLAVLGVTPADELR